MEERTKAILAALSGALAALAEDYGMILLLGCAFILLDLVTGLAKAKISRTVCSAVAATMMARIMENDNSITPKDLYDWGVWTVRGNAPWANWTQNKYSQLHFTFEEPATQGWSTAKGLIFDEIMEERPVIIWLTNNSGGTHFVVAYGLKRGASRENLQYNQIMVLNPYPMPNNGIYEDGTLDEVMQLALWSKFGSIRRAIV